MALASCGDDNNEPDPQPTPTPDPDPPIVEVSDIEKAIYGSWRSEALLISFKSDHTGILKRSDMADRSFSWSFNSSTLTVTADYDGDIDTYVIKAISPDYAVILTDGDDEAALFVRTDTATADVKIVESTNPWLGTWKGYVEDDTPYMMTVNISSDGMLTSKSYDLKGNFKESETALWWPSKSSSNIMVYYIEPAEFDIDTEEIVLESSTENSRVIKFSDDPNEAFFFLEEEY